MAADNLTGVRDELIDTFNKLKNGEITCQQANSEANVAAKIMATSNNQVKYAKDHEIKDKIPFIENGWVK